jgi:hypothetical protein
MHPITRYRLETHDGPYDAWPATSGLLVDDVPIAVRLPGSVIDAQYDTPHGALVVTSYDCPYEEAYEFLLLDRAHRPVARRTLGVPYGTFLLDAHWPERDDTLVLHFQRHDFRRLRIGPPWPLVGRTPRLRLEPVLAWRRDARMRESAARLEAQLAAIRDALMAEPG